MKMIIKDSKEKREQLRIAKSSQRVESAPNNGVMIRGMLQAAQNESWKYLHIILVADTQK